MDREYDWKFDKNNHVFGKSEPREAELVRKCLKGDDQDYPKTNIVKKNLEDFKDFSSQHLGVPGNLGQTKRLHDPNMVFGKNPKGADEWDVNQCIRGDSTFKEAYVEPDLGRATKHGFRNIPKSGDEDRYFGTPSVREDIKAPKRRSLATTQVILIIISRIMEMNLLLLN